MKLSIGVVIAQRYEILEKLGSGGMSIVYRALDKKLNRSVTFKVMREEFCTDENFIKKFNIEARATASISHLNLVNVYDVGNEGQIYYIVMEYIDGLTLKDLIKRKAPFAGEEILGVAIQIAAALQHAHKNEIVHRDVKPQNILITRDFTVKVTDFGIAQSSSDSTKVTNESNMGSVHYFSPEQARGGYVDFKSDIYSLGIVMYEMATGELPFDSDAPVSIALMHINEPIPDIKAKNPNISEAVIKIILKATEKLSLKRYQDITEMLDIMKRTLTKLDESTEVEEEIDEDEKYHTIKFSEEDVTAIRREARQVFFSDDDEDEEDEPKKKSGKKKKVYQNLDEEIDDEDEYDDEDYEDYEQDDSYDEAYELYSGKANKYKEKYKNKSDKDEVKVVIAAILTSLIIVLSVLLFVYLQIKPLETNIVEETTYMTVPQFIDTHIDDANILAENLGITIVIASEVYSEKEEGVILEQSFEQGREIQAGQMIDVSVSMGSMKQEVPKVDGILFSEAYEILVEHFVPEIVDEYNSDTPVQIVFHQDPAAGEMLEPGGNVTIYVSRGVADETVIVPNVVSETEGRAILSLQETGLIVRTINRISSSTVEDGLVISQSIMGGDEVQKGEFIDINVSTGQAIDDSVEIEESEIAEEDFAEVEEVQASSSSGKNTITLPMDYTYVPDEIDPITIRVSKYTTESGSSSVIYEEEVPRANFPVDVEIEGEGQAIIILSVFYDGSFREQGRQTVNFDTVQTISANASAEE